MQSNSTLQAKAEKIKLMIFDIDGVLTDGSLYLGENGNEYKAFNSRDGLGLVLLKKSGIAVAVITARSSNIVADRMSALGVEYVYQGQENKNTALQDLLIKLNITADEAGYLGDDLIDLPAMMNVGLSVAVNDAHSFVKEKADAVTELNGGRGAAREVCEFILESQGKLTDLLKSYAKQS